MAIIDLNRSFNNNPETKVGPLEVASLVSGGIQRLNTIERSHLTHDALVADAFASMWTNKSSLNGLGVHGLLLSDLLIDSAKSSERMFWDYSKRLLPEYRERDKHKNLGESNWIPKPLPELEPSKAFGSPSDPNRSDILRLNLGIRTPSTKPLPLSTKAKEPPKDSIYIVDIDTGCEEQEEYRSIPLQGVPREIVYTPESNFKSIGSIGRNNPHYMYTGSEDTLEMEIDWYSVHKSRRDVIFKCRWLEALTKADGYKTPPHRVMILWGGNGTPVKIGGAIPWQQDPLIKGEYESDITMFENMVWLLVSAPYTLNQFTRGFYDKSKTKYGVASPDSDPEVFYVDNKLHPAAATQKLVFKRLTEYNLSRNNIVFPLTNSYTSRYTMFKTKKELDKVSGMNLTTQATDNPLSPI